MGREKKKGQAGNAKAYITRAKALKKLQLSLPEWRRLCIIKGIYPRDPKRKPEGADKTYYLRKDIDFLAHERLIDTIRAENIHRRKVVKAKSKKQLDVLKALFLKAPHANLDHIIVERYPQFRDALAELDDPLCVVALFATLPATAKVGLAAARVANCRRLMNEFMNIVSRTHALRRVFVSIKGYYYQAELEGELVTWVTPHRFTQSLPSDVDYSVMLTFLELYECLLNFVNFRLYTSQNLAYPPKVDAVADAAGHELAAVRDEKKTDKPDACAPIDKPGSTKLTCEAINAALAVATAGAEMEAESDDEEDEAEKGAETSASAAEGGGDNAADREDEMSVDEERELLFGGKVVVLGRETPGLELEFVLKAAGALRVIRQDDLSDSEEALNGVTHWVIDRPAVTGTRVMSVEYVQPQFVFDSINAGVLLPPALYGPGVKIPPHLSPFVGDEEDGGYRPWFKDVIERLKAGDTTVMDEAAVTSYMKASGSKSNGAAVTLKRSRANGDAASGEIAGDEEELGEKSEKESDESEEEDDEGDDAVGEEGDTADREKELKLIMMSRKKRKQYNKIAKEAKRSTDRKEKLTAKRNRAAGDDNAPTKRRRSSNV
jgi:pescadillo